MSWYRTYRPRQIADLHLASVRETFLQWLKKGQLSQVMLFAGPKGTGKTTTARIIAALVNDPQNYPIIEHLFFKKAAPADRALHEPDPKNSDLSNIFEGRSFLVQELDAASNRGIDDIRTIKERINLPPQQGLMTVYILDEAHMLTNEAFNALLKLLEEPPSHVVFILATTELHKIPETIKSRATLVQFTRANETEISQALAKILEIEKTDFEPMALTKIAEMADGSFRDAVKLAENLVTKHQKLTVAHVTANASVAAAAVIPQLLQAVIDKQPEIIVKIFEKMRTDQADQQFFTKQILAFLHTNLLQHLQLKNGTPFAKQPVILFLLQELAAIPAENNAPIPFLQLELKLLELVFRSQDRQKTPPVASGPTSPTQPIKKASTSQPSVRDEKKLAPAQSTPVVSEILETENVSTLSQPTVPVVITNLEAVSDNLENISAGDSEQLLTKWESLIELVKDKNSSLAALLRSAKPLSASQGSAKIAVFYKFHKEQLQLPKFVKMIEDCVTPLTGGRVKLEFVLQDIVPTNPEVAPAAVGQISEVHSSQDLATLAEELLV